MAYYDKIAAKWNKVTGYKGGAFKELILNDKVIAKAPTIGDKTILEIGIGNGYFMPLLLRKKSGQVPQAIYLTDISTHNLKIAQKQFKVEGAIYQKLDIYKPMPYKDQSVDVVISNMVFNELRREGIKHAFQEIRRILSEDGQFIISTLHPAFIEAQLQRGVIKNNLMLSKEGLKLPVQTLVLEDYTSVLDQLDFDYETEAVYGNKQLFNMKKKLKEIEDIPIALIIAGGMKG